MLTYPAEFERDERAGYRPYRVAVSRLETLSPSFVKVTLSGADLRFFAPHGLDQRIKLLFPVGGRLPEIGVDDERARLEGSWYARWRDLPDEQRAPFRTYTVGAIRPADREIDVEFVSHGDGGPAARWLLGAAVGDELIVVGPDARSINSEGGIDWHPGTANELLLVGDATAVPAIRSIVESLPADARARVFLEVPYRADITPITSAADVTVTWLARDEASDGLEVAVRAWAAAEPTVLAAAVATQEQELDDVDIDVDILWDAPEDQPGEFYAWMAGESAVIKNLRRHLVSELGIDRRRVAFMGYWRLGKAEGS